MENAVKVAIKVRGDRADLGNLFLAHRGHRLLFQLGHTTRRDELTLRPLKKACASALVKPPASARHSVAVNCGESHESQAA